MMREAEAIAGLMFTVSVTICRGIAGQQFPPPNEQVELLDPYWAAGMMLKADGRPRCSVILLTDGRHSSSSDSKDLGQLMAPWGVGVFEGATDSRDPNVTQAQLSRVIGEVRRLRQVSWCVTVVVVSDDSAFLANFAQWSLKDRLLVWSTRLLTVTRLPLQELWKLLSSHWTFSMMNTMLLVLEDTLRQPRFGVYVNLPYNINGPQVIQVAFWTAKRGLLPVSQVSFFPEKFTNFYGATVNITALPHKPYWNVMDDQDVDGTIIKRYTGSDAMLLITIAEALNFTFYVLPVTTWEQVTARVLERVSFMATVYHVVLPQRRLRHDYTYTYNHVRTDFTMAKPSLRSNWQSLYDPLAHEVWASVLMALLLVPLLLFMITRPLQGDESEKMDIRDTTQVVFGALLAQSVISKLPRASSSWVLMAAWLVFAFIIGTAYQGNLTAALTLPKYPPRPETIMELVKDVDKVTMPPYGEQFKKFFRQSDSQVFQALSDLMKIVPTTIHGLREASKKKEELLSKFKEYHGKPFFLRLAREAFMDNRRYLEQVIADNFTRPDGSTLLYIGRESVLPGLGAWPIPHDAPYKTQLDRLMMNVIEAGLYEKWIGDMLFKARQEGRRRQRATQQQQQQQQSEAVEDEDYGRGLQALALRHMQGPLILLLLGLCLSCLIFVTEIVIKL